MYYVSPKVISAYHIFHKNLGTSHIMASGLKLKSESSEESAASAAAGFLAEHVSAPEAEVEPALGSVATAGAAARVPLLLGRVFPGPEETCGESAPSSLQRCKPFLVFEDLQLCFRHLYRKNAVIFELL